MNICKTICNLKTINSIYFEELDEDYKEVGFITTVKKILQNIINFKVFVYDPPEYLAFVGRIREIVAADGDCLFNSIIQSLHLNLSAKELR